jgi:glycosyltransferase involved in cell wall biosynthesis
VRQVALAHDYFLQMGGAERVANAWLNYYTESYMHTLAYAPKATFTSLDSSRVRSKLHGDLWAHHLHKILPLLPSLASSVTVGDGDVALVSTSGWAHQFAYEVPTVAYVHSPARWLHAADDYRLGLAKLPRVGLRLSSNYLKAKDRPAMQRMDRIICNSNVTQERVWKAYGRDSEVVSPPVTALSAVPVKPREALPESFLLIVARNRGYKRLESAAKLARDAGRSLVLIGSGTEVLSDPSASVYGLGRTTDGELKWLYQNADVLLATAREDFGLTVLEANSEGTPVVAVPAGGYLETVEPGTNGMLATSDSLESFGPALQDALSIPSDTCRSWASKFSLHNHMAQLEKVIDDVAA